jgi:non-heme chloroperoxidase
MEINSTAESVFYFDSLICKTSELPALEAYSARDGAQLTYRKYNSPQRRPKRILILLHGSGWHSQQFFKLAPELTSLGDVYTPDLRGHGPNPNQRGDVAYIGQLEDDLADFIEFLKFKHDDVAVTVLGHSSGGGLAIRFAAGLHGSLVDSFLLLAPYIHPTAPVTKRDQRWAAVSLPKLILIGFLNSFGFERFNNTKVIEFNLPKHLHDGTASVIGIFSTLIQPHERPAA